MLLSLSSMHRIRFCVIRFTPHVFRSGLLNYY